MPIITNFALTPDEESLPNEGGASYGFTSGWQAAPVLAPGGLMMSAPAFGMPMHAPLQAALPMRMQGHRADPVFAGVLGNLQRFYEQLSPERKQAFATRVAAAKKDALGKYVGGMVPAVLVQEFSDAEMVQHTSAAALLAALSFFAGEVAPLVEGDDDGTAQALERLQQEQAMRERAGGFVGPTEVHRRLGVSRQTVLDWTKGHDLLAVEDNGRRRYPLCQFTGRNQVIAGLPDVLKALASEGIAGWMALDVLLDEAPRYGRSPLALLRDGRAGDALKAVQAYATQGGA